MRVTATRVAVSRWRPGWAACRVRRITTVPDPRLVPDHQARPSVAVHSRDPQPLIPAGPSSSRLTTPSASLLPSNSSPSSTSQPPASSNTLTPTEFR